MYSWDSGCVMVVVLGYVTLRKAGSKYNTTIVYHGEQYVMMHGTATTTRMPT
jgi:hypothetical protein